MTLDEARHLIDYHYWARDRMLAALEPLDPEQYRRDLGSSFGSVRDTVVHIYGAEWVWYSRWTGVSPAALPAAAEYPDLPALAAAWTELERQVRSFVDRLDTDGLTHAIAYRRANGTAERSTLEQMLRHVVNHATYHRGQVTTLLRQLGAAPPKPTDFIAFDRHTDTLVEDTR